MRADMRLRDLSLRQDPDLRQELASLARGCDFVLPSRFKKRLKAFQQVRARGCCVCAAPERSGRGLPVLGGGGFTSVREQRPFVRRASVWPVKCAGTAALKRRPQLLSESFSRWYRGAWKTPAERIERAGEALALACTTQRGCRCAGSTPPPNLAPRCRSVALAALTQRPQDSAVGRERVWSLSALEEAPRSAVSAGTRLLNFSVLLPRGTKAKPVSLLVPRVWFIN